MAQLRKDGLLITVKVLLQILGAITAIAALALAFGTVAVLADVGGGASRALAGAPPEATYWLSGVCALAAIMLVIGLFFLFELIKIVNSVGEGDPFRPENAAHLTRMGWLALAFQLVSIGLAPLTYLLSQYVDSVDAEGGLSLQGIVLVLTLFVLARVFRQGAAMREDLEGTV
jgi:hypothetical protein